MTYPLEDYDVKSWLSSDKYSYLVLGDDNYWVATTDTYAEALEAIAEHQAGGFVGDLWVNVCVRYESFTIDEDEADDGSADP